MDDPPLCKCSRPLLPATWLSEGTGLCPWCAEQRRQAAMQKPKALRYLHEWKEKLVSYLMVKG